MGVKSFYQLAHHVDINAYFIDNYTKFLERLNHFDATLITEFSNSFITGAYISIPFHFDIQKAHTPGTR